MPADLPQTFIAYVRFTQMEVAGQLYPPHGPTHARMLTMGWCAARQTFQSSGPSFYTQWSSSTRVLSPRPTLRS